MISIGVIGSGQARHSENPRAYDLGRRIALSGAILVCGGLSGVMEAASRGASEAGGAVLGFLPGEDRSQANPYVTIPVPTGMGVGRNLLVVRTSDALIALEGGTGTLSEIALSLNLGKTVIDLGEWKISGMVPATDPEEAVALAAAAAGNRAVP